MIAFATLSASSSDMVEGNKTDVSIEGELFEVIETFSVESGLLVMVARNKGVDKVVDDDDSRGMTYPFCGGVDVVCDSFERLSARYNCKSTTVSFDISRNQRSTVRGSKALIYFINGLAKDERNKSGDD